ncbi:MAG: CBS domain-containing protein [Thermoleophilia bacterium]|nr:CBS domain-containing protein [Thermoleophilia bacterium]
MNRVAVIARFKPEQAELVKALLTAGPPYELADTAIDRHAVFLSAREVTFVFEGPEVEWEVEDLADDFFNPDVRAALSEWRTLLEEEPHIGRPVFVWERGSDQETEKPLAARAVADAMDESFVRVAPEDTLGEAVARMVDGDGAPALVADYGRLIGLLSAHDVLRAVAERVLPSDGRVREWMSEVPASVAADATADEAAVTMVESGLHHLPVVSGERPVGLVSLHRLLRLRVGERA